jgi:protein-tyrosine phosphatase
MQYAIIFFSLGTFLILLSLKFGLIGWLLCWFGANLVAVGAAYGWLGARVFGKQSNGTIASWALCLLLPYLLLTWMLWHIQRLISKEKCCNEIAPGIWLGRRAFAHELPDNISLLVDLTAELAEPLNVISGRNYICIPTLDASVPDEKVVQLLVKQLAAWQGNMYIHCALGHGRSATVAAATLVAKGLVGNMNQAEEFLKKARPGINFSHAQRQLLTRVGKLGLLDS